MTFRTYAWLFASLLLLASCGGGSTQDPTAPPKGWQTAGGRWWKPAVDTARAFRNLTSLKAMGVVSGDKVYSASAANVSADQLALAVKEQLAPLYRNQPHVIDSLFEAHVRPQIEEHLAEQGLGSSLSETAKNLKDEGYKTLRDKFREPSSTTTLGEDVTVTYPDSLRRQGIGGRVQTQVYLDKKGQPQAVRLIKGVGNPVLDEGTMRTVTKSSWRPAYVLQGGAWKAVPSWVRYNLNFTPS